MEEKEPEALTAKQHLSPWKFLRTRPATYVKSTTSPSNWILWQMCKRKIIASRVEGKKLPCIAVSSSL